MRMAIPLTRRAKKLAAVIQCVMRTNAECRGDSRLSEPRMASPGRYVVSAISYGDINTRLHAAALRRLPQAAFWQRNANYSPASRAATRALVRLLFDIVFFAFLYVGDRFSNVISAVDGFL